MKQKWKEHFPEFVIAVSFILCLFLICSCFLLLQRQSVTMKQESESKVKEYSHSVDKGLNDTIDSYLSLADKFALEIAKCTTRNEVLKCISDNLKSAEFVDVWSVRYFSGGLEMNDFGELYEFEEAKEVKEAAGGTETLCLGSFYDAERSRRVVGFYAPVIGNKLVDKEGDPIDPVEGIVLICKEKSFVSLFEDIDQNFLDNARTVAFCNAEGVIFNLLKNEDPGIEETDNIMEVLRGKINSKEVLDGVERAVKVKDTTVFPTVISGENHFVSVCGSGEDGGGYCVVGIYRSSDLYSEDAKLITTIVSIIVVIFFVLIAFSIFFFTDKRKTKRQLHEASSVHPLLGCYTVNGLQKVCEEILRTHKATKFAMIACEVRFFSYIAENLGTEVSEEFLKYLKVVFDTVLTTEEELGYFADGQFYLMMHYRDEKTLYNRLRTIDANAAAFPEFQKRGHTVKLNFGVYEIDRTKTEKIRDILNKAIAARDSLSAPGHDDRIKFYKDSVRESFLQVADVESKADYALKNNEFVVFYQPKINIAKNCIESCEALVRWYNPEQDMYRRPDTFLPQFEANGFVKQLDRYVYKKVCEFISDCLEKGLPVVPVSVNVSRVTASQDNFLEYYIGLKWEYKIPDNLITLEFTESFAYENYDYLNEIVTFMHKNGFLSSIDDFGSGSSSYNILKKIRMDEIKLDAFFIKPGISKERDNLILKTVIRTAKVMGMKVVQEGVELEEDVKRLKEFGCDVIQGYYFSKPLGQKDYLAYLENDREKHKKEQKDE